MFTSGISLELTFSSVVVRNLDSSSQGKFGRNMTLKRLHLVFFL